MPETNIGGDVYAEREYLSDLQAAIAEVSEKHEATDADTVGALNTLARNAVRLGRLTTEEDFAPIEETVAAREGRHA